MALFTVVTIVRDGQLQVVGVLEGAYGVTDGRPDEESAEMGAHVIEAETREAADQIVRERYYPEGVGGGYETPC